jgi:hypothetical protein
MSNFNLLTDKERKMQIIESGYLAVEELIKIAKEAVIGNDNETDLAADKLKNAAATKKLAIFDAFEILNKIEEEKAYLELDSSENKDVKFAESRTK